MYVADFETITDPLDCRVWAYACCNIDDTDDIYYGNSIDDFFKWCEYGAMNSTVFFHNLKFDGSFILDWLLHNNFTHVTNRSDIQNKTFTTLISEGMFYEITVIFTKIGRKTRKVTFRDSLKILPMSVDKMAKAFNLNISKLSLDYNTFREIGHKLTDEEIDYITNDVVIVAKAVKFMLEQGMKKMTTASNALNDYKGIIGDKNFSRWFPKPSYDSDVRQSYRGGFTYLNPKFANMEIGEGIVLDVNSLYPSIMYYEKLPYCEPIFFLGEYKEDKLYDVYVQMFTCTFELKPDHIPTIQLKHNLSFVPTEYITSSNDEEVTMCLTSVDLKLFLDHYNVYNITYHSGWKFKSAVGLFKDYIDKWSNVKIEAKKDGNGGMYTLSKLMLNSLYGKFGSRTKVRNQIPYLDENDVVRYTVTEQEDKDPIYIPIASFITAYARNKTIRAAQSVYDRFIYADTDSLHLVGLDVPKQLDVDKTKLGAWDNESTFVRAKFIRAKTYLEQSEVSEEDYLKGKNGKKGYLYERFNELYCINKITCAGMPESCYQYVTFDNFNVGSEYNGKLQTSHVKGGAVLKETTFNIKL